MPSLSRSSSVVAVQTTNDSSLLSKYSMIEAGYFTDPYIGEFVTKSSGGRRTALINRGYYVRAKAIESAVFTWLSYCRENYPQHYQIVSLGAGFDTLYFRLNCTDVKVFEVDYQDVVRRKAALIKNSILLSSSLPADIVYAESSEEGAVLHSLCYKLIGVDLKNIEKLERELTKCGVDFQLPTLLLSECAITYMRESDSTRLIKWASDHFKDATFTTYEQISPDDGFGQVMMNHFQSTGSPLLSIEHYKTALSQQKRYLDMGWSACAVIDMNTFYQSSLTEDERRRVDQLELFEEFEEFHQKCAHYILISASRGRLSNYTTGLLTVDNIITHNQVFNWNVDDKIENIKRFGHRSTLLNNKYIVTIGGFGTSEDGHHKRMTSIGVSNINSGENALIMPSTTPLKGGIMYHSLIEIDNSSFLIIGGRTSPSVAFEDVHTVKFDVNNKVITTWQPIIEKTATTCNGPGARWRHSATSVTINGKMKIIVFGGRSVTQPALSDCYCLDVESLEWTKLPVSSDDSSPSPRHSHSACCWKTKVVVSGGLSNCSLPTNDIHILDCTTFQWTRLNSEMLMQRYSHTSHIWREKLFLIGGVNMTMNSPGIGIVDLITAQCWELSLPTFPHPILLYKHSSVLLEDEDSIVVLGGGGNCFSFGTHFNKFAMKINLKELDMLQCE